jgi:hypothetical protein
MKEAWLMPRALRLAFLLCTLLGLLAACGTGAGAGGAFPTSAGHPQPQEETFHGCPPTGDGGDEQLNTLKNRIDDGQYVDVGLADLLQLTWPQTVERVARADWSSQDTAAVAQNEGVAVRVEGYILDVRHEGTESTNCHAVDYRDFHMWLAANASDGKDQAMVIEVTPRIRDKRPGWTDAALFALKGQQVRISGWTLLDQEHPEQLNKTRHTLWEIHPIVHIEVYQNGSWVSIDS